MPIWQLLSILASILVAAVAVAFKTGKWLQRIDQDIKGARSEIKALRQQQDSQLSLLGSLIRLLHHRQALSDDELGEVLSSYSRLASAASSIPSNPLTVAERDALRHYVAKAQRGEFFTAEEVEEYNSLVKKLEEEKPGDPGVWPLVALGAFLLGLFVATKGAKK